MDGNERDSAQSVEREIPAVRAKFDRLLSFAHCDGLPWATLGFAEASREIDRLLRDRVIRQPGGLGSGRFVLAGESVELVRLKLPPGTPPQPSGKPPNIIAHPGAEPGLDRHELLSLHGYDGQELRKWNDAKKDVIANAISNRKDQEPGIKEEPAYLGDGRIRIDGRTELLSVGAHVMFLEAIIDRHGVASTKDLERATNNPSQTAKEMLSWNNGFLRPVLFTPGKGQKNVGYRTTLRDCRNLSKS